MSDFITFQLKLMLDGFKDGAVFAVSFVAFAADLIFKRRGRERYFYKVLKLSQHFDGWLNLHGTVDALEENDSDADRWDRAIRRAGGEPISGVTDYE